MDSRRTVGSRSAMVIAALLVVSSLSILGAVPNARADTPVTLSKTVQLGFTSSIPINLTTGSTCDLSIIGCVFSHDVSFVGTADIKADLGVKLGMTYDPALMVPGGSVPVTLTYTPVPNGSTAEFDVSGTATIDFTGCTDCPFTTPLTVASGGATFTAPMGSDTPISIPGSSSTLDIGPGLISAGIDTTLTLAPAPPGTLAGLGGAAALVTVTGATTSQVLPVEWDSAGATQTVTLNLPSTPGPVDVSLGPIVHWLNTTGSVSIPLHWGSVTDALYTAIVAPLCAPFFCIGVPFPPNDPSPISVFSGSLGQFYTSAGLDTQIGNAVSTAIGPPLGSIVGGDIATNIGKGLLPIPLLSPPLASIPPLTASLGTVDFGIPFAGITGTPTSAVLLGDVIALHAAASGGTGPYTYVWTKDGGAFGGTSDVVDTPSLGSHTYAVTVTDSLGAVSNTASVTVNVYDFSLANSPTTLQVLTTGSNAYSPGTTEALVAASTTTGLPSLALSLSGLPSGATGTFTPSTGNAIGFTSGLGITAAGATAGTYTLTITGTDSTTGFGGSRTTTTSLTVLTPAQALPQLVTQFNGLVPSTLNNGQANSFTVKIGHAISDLNAGKPNTACNELNALVNEINSYVAGGILTVAQADSLLDGPLGINAVMASIPC